MKVIAYHHGPDRIFRLAQHFANGCSAHGIKCEIQHIDAAKAEPYDVVWLYGLGPARAVFDLHPDAMRIVGDKGYFHEQRFAEKYFRISINAQQPDWHIQLVKHPADRFEKLGIKVKPVESRGNYILLCGMGPKQADRQGYAYGQWERETYHKLERPGAIIQVREKPKNPPIYGLPRSGHATTGDAIRGAHSVICYTGNIGADAILHGVPVMADSGPGYVWGSVDPLAPEVRIQALSDIAYWQWTQKEMASGEMWANLVKEGIV